MDNQPHRKHTFYTKDVLPPKVLENLNKTYLDMDQAVKNQVAVVQQCEASLNRKCSQIVAEVSKIISNSVERPNDVAALNEEFLNSLLKRVKKEEIDLRTLLLGQQESVEMFKQAVADSKVDPSHLEIEREQRNKSTVSLSAIVEEREILFSALEIQQRLGLNVDECDFSNISLDIGPIMTEYKEMEVVCKQEHDKLKKFTEWQRNPGLMIRKCTSKDVA